MGDEISYLILHTWKRGGTSYLFGHANSGTRVDTWRQATIGSNPFSECYPGSSPWGRIFITKSLYDSLTDSEKAIARSRSNGMVDGNYWRTAPWTDYTGRVWQIVYFKEENIVECWKDLCFTLRPDLYCVGVECEDTCIGPDKYSQVCVTEGENPGECTFDQLLKANSPDCPGYDPCLGVVCEDKCYGYDLHKTYCVGGDCIKGSLIEANNREICGYDPCRGVVCEDECFGADKWRMECEEGTCVPDRVIEPNSSVCGYVPPPPPDPCKGVVCDPECYNDDLHETICEDGVCIKGVLIEADSATCGYVPPDPIPPTVCNEGELRGATVCGDGQTIYAEICQNNKWVATGDRCPEDPIPPVPDPDPDGIDWTTIALIGAAVVLFWLLATRGSS